MTRVFVYEYCTAVGLGRATSDPAHSLFREGAAMRDAVAADFDRAAGFTAVTLDGTDATGERQRFTELAASADAVLVIAPEFDGLLAERCAWVRAAGRICLNPSAGAIDLTADKLALARRWQSAGVPTPLTWRVGEEPPAHYPVVWKPQFGAGSTATMLLRRPEDQSRYFERFRPEELPAGCRDHLIGQEYIRGRAASVAFLVGPRSAEPLLPTFQRLSTDDRFTYQGGQVPIPPGLAARSIALSSKAIDSVSGLIGFVGIDIVLGECLSGSADFAIEINPRLTTSYVGLRKIADFNLAEAIFCTAQGMPVPALHWKTGSVQFGTTGVQTVKRSD